MKKNLKNFTSGSQLIENFTMMFAAGFKTPLWLLFMGGGLSLWIHWATMLSSHAQYLAIMHAQASAYDWMGFDPSKTVVVKSVGGGDNRLTWGTIRDYPSVAFAWIQAKDAAWRAILTVLGLLVPMFALYYWYAVRFGDKARARTHLGGARLAPFSELVRLINARNSPQRAKDIKGYFGPWWWIHLYLAKPDELDTAGIYRPYKLGGIDFPYRLEQSHVMLVGTTGTGKTVELSSLTSQIRERNHRAVIFDLTGVFIERFYDPDRDIILNPLDARCPSWSIFNECETEAEFTTMWQALVPHDGGTGEPFWVQAARMLGVETCMKLKKEGRGSNHALYTELMTADLEHVHKLLEQTLADPITAPEAARMAESVRAVFNTNLCPIRLLPDQGPSFSIKDWILNDDGEGSILFISSRYVDMSVTRTFLSSWMDTALNTLMTMERSRDVRMWILIDELGALHRLPALEKGLQTARNYGGAIVLGVHAFGKLKDTYGQNVAETLASLARTKLLLATDDRPTAVFSSDCIGHRQFREMEEGYSYGYSNERDAVTLTPRRNMEPLVLPDDLMNMENLHGYVKFPSGFPAAAVKIDYVEYESKNEPFMARDMPIGAPVKVIPHGTQPPAPVKKGAGNGSSGATTSGDGGQGIAITDPVAEKVEDKPKLKMKLEAVAESTDPEAHAKAWAERTMRSSDLPTIPQAEIRDTPTAQESEQTIAAESGSAARAPVSARTGTAASNRMIQSGEGSEQGDATETDTTGGDKVRVSISPQALARPGDDRDGDLSRKELKESYGERRGPKAVELVDDATTQSLNPALDDGIDY